MYGSCWDMTIITKKDWNWFDTHLSDEMLGCGDRGNKQFIYQTSINYLLCSKSLDYQKKNKTPSLWENNKKSEHNIIKCYEKIWKKKKKEPVRWFRVYGCLFPSFNSWYPHKRKDPISESWPLPLSNAPQHVCADTEPNTHTHTRTHGVGQETDLKKKKVCVCV